MRAAKIDRLIHMKGVLQMLKGKESLYYGEYAAVANVSMSYASNLFRMVAYRFNVPHKNGVLDNPGDQKIDEFVKALDAEIRKLRRQASKSSKGRA